MSGKVGSREREKERFEDAAQSALKVEGRSRERAKACRPPLGVGEENE